MHSYGLFWQLPASLEVNPGELAAPWASLLLPPGSQAFKHRLFTPFTRDSLVIHEGIARGQSGTRPQPVFRAYSVVCGNNNLQVLM